jgi:hypothetical protein
MLVNYFVVLTILLLISGLAIDAGMLEFWQIHLQNAADAAAQQAMYQFGRNDSAFATEGKAQASANGFTDGAKGVTVTINQPPVSTEWVNDKWSVQATVSQPVSNLFMSLVNAGSSTLVSTAVARVLPTCIWIMNPTNTTSKPSFWLAAGIISGACGLYVNTSAGPSMEVDSSTLLLNLRSRVVGPQSGSTLTGSVIPIPKFNAAQKNDPLAYVTSPSFSACTPGYTALAKTNFTGSIGPGTYCGGLSISNSTLTLTPGLYIFTGGLTINGSIVYGTSGVTLFFTSGGGYSYGNININSSALYLKAATTNTGGTVPGIILFGDRNWISHGNRGVSFQNTTIQNDGIWYFPNIGVSMSQSPLSYYSYNGIIADNLYYSGDISTMNVDYAPLGSFITGTPYHYEDGALVN